MASGKEIRTQISSIKSTQKITSAMEMVAASKMRKAQERMSRGKAYANKIKSVIGHVANANSEYQHIFMEQREPGTLPSVFASTHGDLAITDYMCETLASTPELLSPIRFHNSVHNAAAGYWAIATGNMRPYTAISAGRYSFGNGLLEALVQAQSDNESVLLVAYDIAARGPLANVVSSTGRLGCALVLGCQPTPTAKYVLQWQLRETGQQQENTPSTEPACLEMARTESASLVAGNAMAPALPMFEAIACSPGGGVCPIGPNLHLELELSPVNQRSCRSTS